MQRLKQNMITFGQYNTLHATRQQVTLDQLCSQTDLQQMMVRYYVAGLLKSGLIVACTDLGDSTTRYVLTDAGVACLDEYERHNPELTLTRTINQLRGLKAAC